MGDIVNLAQFRKRRERELKETRAKSKRQQSGASKADRESLRREIEKHRRDLDGKLVDRGPTED